MIKFKQNFDPVIMDLNRYLAAQDQYDIRREHIQAMAEKEFSQLDYMEIIEYHNDYREIVEMFNSVESGNITKAKAALNAFIEGVKEIYLEHRTREIEQEEENDRINDKRIELYLSAMEEC